MNLVVDASVVIKWFIDEPLHENARHLLNSRGSLHAPDLLLAEIGNIAWKKVIRNEIGEEQAQKITLSLGNLPVTLQSSGELIDRALQIALSIQHPVYDCLYLACAESLGSTLITADERLIRSLKGTSLAILCRNLEDRYGIALSEESIQRLVQQFKQISATWKSIVDADDIKFLDTPGFPRIKKSIQALSDAEKIDLVALGWLGRGGMGRDWPQLQENVRKSFSLNNDKDLVSLIRFSEYIEIGWHKFQKMAHAETKK